MSIIKAISRAYEYANQRKYPKIYIALDLHGVCFRSNYEQGGYTWINDQVVRALRSISNQSEVVIILFSSCHPEEQPIIMQFFADNGIKVAYFNENPECSNSKSGCFDSKFYYSIVIDDKAGFDPDEWEEVASFFSAQTISAE